MQEIIRVNDGLRDMINQIAATTAEQSATSNEVSKNVAEIARLAQQSSQGSQEAAKACDELSAMALELENIVSQFTIRTKTQTGMKMDLSFPASDDSAIAPLSRGASAGGML